MNDYFDMGWNAGSLDVVRQSSAPVAVGEAELEFGLSTLTLRDGVEEGREKGPKATTLLVLVRMHGVPLGIVRLDASPTEPENTWPVQVRAALAGPIARHLIADGETDPSSFDLWRGGRLPRCRFEEMRATVQRASVLVTVIIATRDRPASLARCLKSILALEYPKFEVLVVDNDPVSEPADSMVAAFAGRNVKYLRQPRRGLANAHNLGLEYARGDVVAFTDDDVTVDRHWLSELLAPFVISDDVVAATGLVMPAQLDTPAQVLLESHGRFVKGFEPFSVPSPCADSTDPFYPFAAGRFGSGANMAFRTPYLRDAGGFDPALGTGTKSKGGDDLAALFGVVWSGRRLVYRPGAIVWHHHQQDPAAVARQIYGYGVGLGAYLTSIVVRQPGTLPALARRLPAFGKRLVLQRSLPSASDAVVASSLLDGPHWPRALSALELRGFVAGPFAYSRSRLTQRRALRNGRS